MILILRPVVVVVMVLMTRFQYAYMPTTINQYSVEEKERKEAQWEAERQKIKGAETEDASSEVK